MDVRNEISPVASRIAALRVLWSENRRLVVLGGLTLPIYALTLVHGDFRPGRIEPFFIIFGAAFLFYALAVRHVLRPTPQPRRGRMAVIYGFALLFNALLVPSRPTLSDDMYRYIWDGRVQAAGFNPYQYRSNAIPLRPLRDEVIWSGMNRRNAVTIYPPGAQLVFAATWRIFPDSIAGMKLVMIAASLGAGVLLALLLRALGQPPERTLIMLWNPLLVFEIAHAAHVDALYLPLIVGAFLLRARAPANRVDWRYEAGIGLLLGLGALIKLYPAVLAPCLWSVVALDGRRRLRLALPLALLCTLLIGYALYIQPGVNVFGFLGQYGREFFNISPLMRGLTRGAMALGIRWYLPGNYGMPLLLALVSLWFVLVPAQSARQAVLRCFWPIGIYLLINHNLFPWYALWLLPLIALALEWPVYPRLNAAFAWWVFTGTTALSYTFFLRWQEESWGIALQFWPFYALLAYVGLRRQPRLSFERGTP